MARKNTEELIHCSVCGEDYSATYRRCPFCGERMDSRGNADDEDFDDGYVFDGQALFDDAPGDDQASPNKGGKRLASGGNPGKKKSGAPIRSGGRYDPPGPVNWVRIVTFAISLIIIIAALIIVFTVIYPMIHNPDHPVSTPPVSTSTPAPSPSDPPLITLQPTPTPTPTPSPSADPAEEAKGVITNAGGGLNVRSGPGTGYAVKASLINGNEVTILADAGEGWYKISYAGQGGQATEGYVKSDYVRVVSGTVPPYEDGNVPAPSVPPVESPADGIKPGSKGTIINAASGLRVRSGPGTTYDIKASLLNGDEITVVADAGSGWYRIAYTGQDGKDTDGFIMGSYIKVK